MDQRLSIAIDARTLSYGVHRLRVAVTLDRSSCANVVAETFIHVKPDSPSSTFAG
jgi:stress response protein SCP2